MTVNTSRRQATTLNPELQLRPVYPRVAPPSRKITAFFDTSPKIRQTNLEIMLSALLLGTLRIATRTRLRTVQGSTNSPERCRNAYARCRRLCAKGFTIARYPYCPISSLPTMLAASVSFWVSMAPYATSYGLPQLCTSTRRIASPKRSSAY